MLSLSEDVEDVKSGNEDEAEQELCILEVVEELKDDDDSVRFAISE